MNDVIAWIVPAAIVLAALATIVVAALKGWQGWLDLKRLELSGRYGATGAGRIELADLKERVRKLEAIASCVDL